LDQNALILTIAIFLLSGVIKGTVCLGLPMAAVGLLASLVDPRLAISLVVFPIMVTNFWQMVRGGNILQNARRYGLFAVVVMVSMALVTIVAGRVSAETLTGVIGAVIIMFSLTSLLASVPYLPDRYDKLGQTVAALACGIIGGLTAIWSPPMAIYFLARRLDKDEFVAASGFLIFLSSLPLALGYWKAGLLTGPLALTSIAMCVPAIVGFTVGEQIRSRLSGDRFRTLVLVLFLFLGINLIRRAFG
jgi:uncharacterized membrane protein YfcA